MKWLFLPIIILFSSLGLFLFYPPASATTATNTLIKASGEAVYFLGLDSKRYVFPNQNIYFSWYENFDLVQTIPDEELASYPLGGNINYRPGTRLIKIVSVPTVYAVGPGGTLSPLLDEAAAISLYGADWSSRVDDLADAFFTGYTIAPALLRDQYPEGSIFKYGDNNDYHYLQKHEGQLKARLIPDDVFISMRWQQAYVLEKPTVFYPISLPITTSEINLSIPNQPSDLSIPIPESATLTLQNYKTSDITKEIVSLDPKAVLMSFALVGDPIQSITTQSITVRFYIDATGTDDDFNIGMDQDDNFTKYAASFVESVYLRDALTGDTISNTTNVSSNGQVLIPFKAIIAPAQSKPIELVVKMKKHSANPSRLALDINPQTDISATASLSNNVSFLPLTSLNGANTPSIISTFIDHGKLIISSSATIGSQILPLDESFEPYQLEFEAQSEDFIVDSIVMRADLIPAFAFVPFNRLEIAYFKENGEEFFVTPTRTDFNVFTFDDLDLWVPRNDKKTARFIITPRASNDDSGTRVRLDFLKEGFRAIPQITEGSFIDSNFSETSKLEDKTNPGAYVSLRNSYPSLKLNADSPTGLAPRFNKSRALIFETMAHNGSVTFKKFSFKIDTSDVDEDGDDNDMLERMADLNTWNLAKIYYHNDTIPAEDRIPVTVNSWEFGIYKPNIGLDTTPQGLQTEKNDYGVIIANLGTGLTLADGQSRILDFELDTTTITAGSSASYKIIIIGDSSSTSTTSANFLWNDGSVILSSGYLVSGLDLYSRILFVN